MSLISVIVPVYKVEDYLGECVESILSQSFKCFELILVDDGSPDNCPKMCDEYAERDNRIVVIHKENGGLSSARNTGLKYAFSNSNSDYVTFIDSDDWVSRDYLKQLYNAINTNNCLVAKCLLSSVECNVRNSSKTSPLEYFKSNEIYYRCLLDNKRYYSTVCATLYKKELLSNISFRKNVVREDEFFTNDLYTNSFNICYLNNELYYYRIRGDSIIHAYTLQNYLDISNAMLDRVLCLPNCKVYKNKKRFTNAYFKIACDTLIYAKQRLNKNNSTQYSYFRATLVRCTKMSLFYHTSFLSRLKLLKYYLCGHFIL